MSKKGFGSQSVPICRKFHRRKPEKKYSLFLAFAWPLRVDDVIKSRVYHARMRTAEKSMRLFLFRSNVGSTGVINGMVKNK